MRWLRSLPLLVQPIIATMPWATLMTGCLAGTALLAVMGRVADASHAPLDLGTARLTFLPAVAALAFVLRSPFRPLTHATPVPAWLAPAGHIALAAPVLAVTFWAQLRIVARTIPPHTLSHPSDLYPVIAQLGPATLTSAGPSPRRSASQPSRSPGTPRSPADSWSTPPPPRTP
jgi:hypothetical protein